MTRKEAAKLITTLAAAYPKFEVDEVKVTVWYEMLGDLDYSVIQAAAKKCILENIFPPSIAEIRKAAFGLLHPELLAAPEAWGLVIQAIHNYGYNRKEEALDSLPAEVAEVVGWMGWQELCHGENIDVIRGQFIKLFETQRKRAQQINALPEDLKAIVSGASQKLKLPEGGGRLEG